MSSAIAETAERFCISCFQLGAVQHKVRVRGAAAHRPPDFASSGLNELKWKNCMYVCSNDWENIGNGATEINANLICFTFLQVACQGGTGTLIVATARPARSLNMLLGGWHALL